MISVSDTFLAALRGPHELAVKAVAYPPSGGSVDLPVIDGAVTIDRTADQRRRLDLTLSPIFPSGHPLEGHGVYPTSTIDPINVYGTEIRVYRGIEFAAGVAEYAPLGVFRIEDAQRDIPGGEVQVTGWDRSMQITDERFIAPRKFGSQTATTLIKTLISEVYPAATFADSTGDSTNIPKHVVDRDRWPEIQRVAQVIGAEVFPDADGGWVIQPVPDPTTAAPVWSVDAGDGGVLVSLTDSMTRDGVPNVVVALGESFNGRNGPVTITHGTAAVVNYTHHEVVVDQQISFHTSGTLPSPLTQGTKYFVESIIDDNSIHISASRGGSRINTTTDGSGNANMDIQGIPIHSKTPHGRDLNTLSPTYLFGAYGIVPRFYSSPHIKTQSQADRVADAQLADHLGATRVISFDSVPNPALEAGDAVTVKRPDGSAEIHLLDVVTISLGPAGTMTAETRARDWNAE